MSQTSGKEEEWVWVLVQDPGSGEQLMGQEDQETGERFVPAFPSREEAQQCMGILAREPGRTYEAQAISLGFLSGQAGEQGCSVYLLDGSGRVLRKYGKPSA